MQFLKKTILFILIFGFVLFGIFNSEIYSKEDSFIIIISYHSIFLMLLIVALTNFFRENILNLKIYELLFVGYWKNIYLFSVYIFLPLLLSIPFLISKNINGFVIVFASCHFQAIIIITFFKLFIHNLSEDKWNIFVMFILFLIVLSNSLNSEEFLLFNPLLGITFLPYYFNQDFAVQWVMLTVLLAYSIIGIMYLANMLIEKNVAHNSK